MSEDLKKLTSEEGSVIEVDSEDFSKLLSVFDTISKLCTDLSIVDGKICQHSDRKNSLISIDVSSVLGNETIHLTGIATKVGLLEPFKKQKRNIEIDNGASYKFRDEHSQIEVTKPIEKYMSNPYMTEDDFQTKLSLADDDVIFEYELEKFLIDRLAAFQKGLAASKLKVEFRGGKADFIVTTTDNNSSVTTGKLMTVELETEVNCDCVFPILPFMLTDDNVIIKGYFRNDGDNLLLNLTTTSEDIPISIWCISEMIKDDEDDEDDEEDIGDGAPF